MSELHIQIDLTKGGQIDDEYGLLASKCPICHKPRPEGEILRGYETGIGEIGIWIPKSHRFCALKRTPISFGWFFLTLVAYIPLRLIGRWDN